MFGAQSERWAILLFSSFELFLPPSKEAMFLVILVCLFVCLICLSFHEITYKVMNGITWNLDVAYVSEQSITFAGGSGLRSRFVFLLVYLSSRMSTYKIMNEFAWNFYQSCVLCPRTINYFLVMIRITIQNPEYDLNARRRFAVSDWLSNCIIFCHFYLKLCLVIWLPPSKTSSD